MAWDGGPWGWRAVTLQIQSLVRSPPEPRFVIRSTYVIIATPITPLILKIPRKSVTDKSKALKVTHAYCLKLSEIIFPKVFVLRV